MKNLKVTVNGVEYDVKVEEVCECKEDSKTSINADKPDKTAKEIDDKSLLASGAEIIKSPMPGAINSIKVNLGDEVKKGQTLLVLEAMKMENEIVSPRDGIIESISVVVGESVESGSKLIAIK